MSKFSPPLVSLATLLFALGLLLFSSCQKAPSDQVLLELSHAWSISFWIQPSTQARGELFNLGDYANGGISVDINPRTAPGTINVKYAENGRCPQNNSGTLQAGRWHHVVWFQHGGYRGLYHGLHVNGKNVSSKERCIVPEDKRKIVEFSINEDFINNLQGVQIFDYALSPEQIKAIQSYSSKVHQLLPPEDIVPKPLYELVGNQK